jgi:hypothetical protein
MLRLMVCWADEQLAKLRSVHGDDWDIWYVPYAVTRQTAWCARPKGHPVATVQAWTPEGLAEQIKRQEAAQ